VHNAVALPALLDHPAHRLGGGDAIATDPAFPHPSGDELHRGDRGLGGDGVEVAVADEPRVAVPDAVQTA
jgi:hypothetical protein